MPESTQTTEELANELGYTIRRQVTEHRAVVSATPIKLGRMRRAIVDFAPPNEPTLTPREAAERADRDMRKMLVEEHRERKAQTTEGDCS